MADEEELMDLGHDSQDNSIVHADSWEMPPPVKSVTRAPLLSSQRNDINSITGTIYSLLENGVDKTHTILKFETDQRDVDEQQHQQNLDTVNILMLDVSSSMSVFKRNIVEGWNTYIAPYLKLNPLTKKYVFSNEVQYLRRKEDVKLQVEDFKGGGTNITAALQTIITEINLSSFKYINVFFFTDGHHNADCDVHPEEVLDLMEIPSDKSCNTYVICLGDCFPVQLSMKLRANLHNGNIKKEFFFLAETNADIISTIQKVADNLAGERKDQIETKGLLLGYPLPNDDASYCTDKFRFDEYIWLPNPIQDEECIPISSNTCLNFKTHPLDYEILQDINRQWNNSIIQRCQNDKEKIPLDIIKVKERLYETVLCQIEDEKEKKRKDMEMRQELNSVKQIMITNEYTLDTAKKVLSTTVVKDKHRVKNLQLRGHLDAEFYNDRYDFVKIYKKHMSEIKEIKAVDIDSCTVTLDSTISHLQEDDFIKNLKSYENKFQFLKHFTMTGIPATSYLKDCIILNPWAYSVEDMIHERYPIMSYNVMEQSNGAGSPQDKGSNVAAIASMRIQNLANENKFFKIDPNVLSSYNVIVPVFPSLTIAKIMKPIMLTKLYALASTFVLTKNPEVINYDIHLAALAVCWTRYLHKYPSSETRPEHIRQSMASIEYTSLMYTDAPRFQNYLSILKVEPNQALMTQSAKYDKIQCETLIKPLYLYYLDQKQQSDKVWAKSFMKLVLMEYVGRCMRKFDNDEKKLHKIFVVPPFSEWVELKERMRDMTREFLSGCSSRSLLASYYTEQLLVKSVRKFARTRKMLNTDSIKQMLQTAIEIDKLKFFKLQSFTNTGCISWPTLEHYAREIKLSEDDISELFGPENIFSYVVHALRYKTSRERLENNVASYRENYDYIATIMTEKMTKEIYKKMTQSLMKAMKQKWLSEYLKIHCNEIVEPMSRRQIIKEVHKRRLPTEVYYDNFDQVYPGYHEKKGLLRNACQSSKCPYYLQAHKSFGQHVASERDQETFIHHLHTLTEEGKGENDENKILDKLAQHESNRNKKMTLDMEVIVIDLQSLYLDYEYDTSLENHVRNLTKLLENHVQYVANLLASK